MEGKGVKDENIGGELKAGEIEGKRDIEEGVKADYGV